jgi:hypothetical protein
LSQLPSFWPASVGISFGLLFTPEDVPSKHRTLPRLYDVTTQKTVLEMVTAIRTSNPAPVHLVGTQVPPGVGPFIFMFSPVLCQHMFGCVETALHFYVFPGVMSAYVCVVLRLLFIFMFSLVLCQHMFGCVETALNFFGWHQTSISILFCSSPIFVLPVLIALI